MPKNELCSRCYYEKECETPCEAIRVLYKICREERNEFKRGIIQAYTKELNIIDYEASPELKMLGEKIIDKMPELHVIKDFDVKIGYVLSYEAKRERGKIVNAECRKVMGCYKAYIPFDFVVTFYEPNIYYMSENQRKLLMLHELKHIGVGEKGLKIENHDIEDFKDMLYRYGISWNEFNQDVPDILAGGDVEKGRKGQKMGAKCKANANS